MGNKINSDLLKGLAIIAVVAIHSFSTSVGSSPVSLFVDQLSRFAVPLFIALSGYGLAMSFAKNNNLIHFYFKRVLKLLPWFVFASVLILIYKGGSDFLNYHTWTMILRGGADYHLYFVPMIFRLYLIFPLLFFIVNKFPRLALVAALLTQIIWYEYSAGWLDQMQYLRPESWIFYFVLGIYLIKNKLNFKPLVAIGFIIMFVHAVYLQSIGTDMILVTRFTRLPVILYATGFILFFVNWQVTNKPLEILGKYSYQIYLLHTLVLRILPNTINPFILTPLVLVLTSLIVYVFTRSLAIFLRRA
ncbi:MAG: acyltransferase [bacterium]|nr:acyltransferase [bacterium]